MSTLPHYDNEGRAQMVDVGGKPITGRQAVASSFVVLSQAVLDALPQNPKGNPLEVARFAGIQAAKRTADLIPMCHPLPLSFIDVQADVVEGVLPSGLLCRHRPPPAWRWKP
jgi:cyclic pyranopterin phosphate synthase